MAFINFSSPTGAVFTQVLFSDNLRVVLISIIHIAIHNTCVSGACLLITATVQHIAVSPALNLLLERLFKGNVYFTHYLDLHGVYFKGVTI